MKPQTETRGTTLKNLLALREEAAQLIARKDALNWVDPEEATELKAIRVRLREVRAELEALETRHHKAGPTPAAADQRRSHG